MKKAKHREVISFLRSGSRYANKNSRRLATLKISIVIPVRDRWHELLNCLESIENQIYHPTEVVVVDDGSISPVVEKWDHRKMPFRLRFVRQSPMGIAAARNAGIRFSNGDLILLTDSDCVFRNDSLYNLSACVLSHPNDIAFQMAFAPTRGRIVWRIDDLGLRAKQQVLKTSSGHIRYLDTAGFAIRRDYIMENGDIFCLNDIRGSDSTLLARLSADGVLPFFVSQALVEHHRPHSLVRHLLRHFTIGYHTSPARLRLRDSTNFLMNSSKRKDVLRKAWGYAQGDCTGLLAFCLLPVAHAIELCGRITYTVLGMRPSHVEVLGIRVDCLRSTELQSEILKAAEKRDSACFTYLTAWSLVKVKRHPNFKRLLSHFTVRYADGMGVVLSVLLLSLRRIHKVTANDFFLNLCQEISRRGLCVALIGGSSAVIENVKRELRSSASELRIVLSASGFLTEDQKQSLIAEMCQKRPHLVVLSMGQPLQEDFALRIRRNFPEAAFLCVGGLFDCIAGVNPTPPCFIRTFGFEWLYRLMNSPKRMWKRYVLGLPVLAIYVLREFALKLPHQLLVIPIAKVFRSRKFEK